MTRFNPAEGLIVTSVELFGPERSTFVRMALDTGATRTLLSVELAIFLGYDPALERERVSVTTGSGIEYCSSIRAQKLRALGRTVQNFPILCHTLPPTAQVDGLLGLDFLRGNRLVVDFQTGEILLE